LARSGAANSMNVLKSDIQALAVWNLPYSSSNINALDTYTTKLHKTEDANTTLKTVIFNLNGKQMYEKKTFTISES
jgi:hypothetical protein